MPFSSTTVRRFLTSFFNDEELESFCFDYFNVVHQDFSTGMPKGEKIQCLIEYCQQHEGIVALFNALQECRPEQYLKHFGSGPPPDQFEVTFTPGDASSSAELSINSLSAMTEKRITAQTEHIHFYQKIAIGLIAAGLIVVAGVLIPGDPFKVHTFRPAVALAGLFICSLSCLQFRTIDQYKDRVGECMIFRSHLEVLKKQPVLDSETRAQVTYWMNQAFEGVMKV